MKQIQDLYPLVLGAENPVLRTVCDKVEAVTPEIVAFWKALLDLLPVYDGVWLAAPQVGKTIRMAAFVQLDMKGKNRKQTMQDVMINPIILSSSPTTEIAEEWCLSLPGQTGDVERTDMIVVEYTNLQWKKVVHKAKWYNARIILHEMDHLDGVLYIDKLA